MPELVVPTVEDAARIAAADQRARGRSRWRLGGVRRGRGSAGSSCRSSIPPRTCGSRSTTTESVGLRGRQRPGGRHARRRGSTCGRSPAAARRWSSSSRGRRSARPSGSGRGGRIQFFADERDDDCSGELLEAARIHASSARRTRWSDRSRASSTQPVVARRASPSGRSMSVTREAVYAAHDEAFADHWGYVADAFEAWSCPEPRRGRGRDSAVAHRLGRQTTSRASASTGRAHGEDEIDRLDRRARACGGRGAAAASARRSSASRFGCSPSAGKRAAGLGVDAENTTGAVALYERVGLRVVRRSDTWERIA